MITKSHDITEEIMMDAACTTVYEFGFENFTTKATQISMSTKNFNV